LDHLVDERGEGTDAVPRLPQRVRSDAAYRRGAALLRLGLRLLTAPRLKARKSKKLNIGTKKNIMKS
jgi:hypothetical protein